MADWMTGLLSGFLDRKGQIEQENLRQADLSRQREGQVFNALINSPDPEIQSLAVAGLLESAKPGRRKGGFGGWLGQMEQSPFLPQIQSLIQTPVRETRQVPVEPPTVQGYLPTPPPGVGAAAQPTTSPTQGGPLASPQTGPAAQEPPIQDWVGAEPRDLGPVATDPRLATAPPTLRPVTTERPRQVFRTPEDQALLTARARAQGDVEGEVAGLVASGIPEAQARDTVRQKMLRLSRGGAVGQTYAEGNIVEDPDSPTGWSQTLYLRADPTQTQRIPAESPLARSTRGANALEAVAHKRYGRPGEDPRAVLTRLTPDEMAGALAEKRDLDAQAAAELVVKKGEAAAGVPLTLEQKAQEVQRQFTRANSLRQDWERISAPSRLVRQNLAMIGAAEAAVRRGDVGAGHETILVTFQKMLDRLSVVREAEYLRPYYNQSLENRVRGYRDQLLEGGSKLPTEQLLTYARLAKEIGQEILKDDQQLAQALRVTADTFQVDPALIFGDSDLGIGQPPPGGFQPSALQPILGGAPPPPTSPTPSPTTRTPAPAEITGATSRAKKVGDAWTITLP